MDTTLQYLLFSACAFLVLMGAMTARAIRRTRGTRHATVFLATRLIAVGLLVYLGYRALGDFRTHTSAPEDQGDRRVMILADHSASMAFPDGDATRGDRVADVMKTVQGRLRGKGGFELTRVDFADNFVEHEYVNDLRRDASRLGNALTGVLTRYRSEAVLIVSDGTSTDGIPPDYVLEWAANRNVGLYAVGIGDDRGSFDARISKVDGVRENPDVLTAHVQCRGGDPPDHLVVRLLVDGKQVESKRVKPTGVTAVPFMLPGVAEGWHDYTVEVASPVPETCLANNGRMGVFRRSPPRKILFLYTTPSADYRQLSAFLRVLYPGQVDAASAFERRIDDLGPEDVVFLILGDVAPSNVPVRLMDSLKAGRLPTLFLPGDKLKEWTRAAVPGFPLASAGAYRNAATLGARIDRGRRHGWAGTEFGALRPTGYQIAAATDGAAELLSVKTAESVHPFLVSDAPKDARLIVLLSDATWRWSLSAEAQTRSAFRAMWRRIAALAVDSPETMQSLKLAVDRGRGASLTVSVTHEDETRAGQLKDVTVKRLEPAQIIDGLRFRDGMWRGAVKAPAPTPSVTWFKASATLDGVTLESELYPLVLNTEGPEYVDTIPHHERLRTLLKDSDADFATAPGVDRLIDRLIRQTQAAPRNETVRNRDWRVELTIGLIMLLVFCTDWLLERNLKEGR